jgi:PAS domain S-box-containing protein
LPGTCAKERSDVTARTELLPAELATQLLANSTDGLMAFDTSFRYTFWNPAMERIYGMPAGDVLGQYAFDLFPFLVETGEDAFFRRALAGEAVTSRNRPYQVHATGRRGHYEGHYYPVRDATGQIAGAMAVIRDVSDQRAAELVLHETENRFKNMADASPVLLWMSRVDGLCTFFNQTWLNFTGRTLEEEWGVGWAEGVHFEDFQRCMDTYTDAFNARKSFEMEYRLQRHDGEYRWILDRGTPRYEADGGFAGFIGSCVDINELKAAQEQMGRAIAGRDEFLSIASHELRTPLTAAQLTIDSLTKRLEHGPAGSADLVKRARAIQEQTLRLSALVSVLLDVSRITVGKLEVEPEEMDLAELAVAVVRRFDHHARNARCPVRLVAPAAVVGRWDRVRIEQVITNLLSNAFKYAPGTEVMVEVGRADGRATLVVRDQGRGIGPELRPRIFNRFERGVSARNYGGLGLGLWISREIVEAHGGAIRVDSIPGHGATFSVDLPVEPARAVAPSARPGSAENGHPAVEVSR